MRIGKVATSDSKIEEITLEVNVIRCECTVKGQHPSKVCPNGRIDPQGIVADYYRKPWKRFKVWLARTWKEGWNSGKVRS